MQSEAPHCSKVPTVDLGELGVHHTEEPSQREWERVTRELEHAFSDIGCAYLTGHGVPDDMIKEVFSSAVAFFKLGKDVKTSWAPDGLIGYLGVNSEKYANEHHEEHESFLFRHGNYGLRKDEAPPFMTSVTPLCQLIEALSWRLMTTLALSLNKDRDYFVNMHLDRGTKRALSTYRLNYYPMTSSGEENITGFGAHIDFTTITFLLSNDSEGFQVCDSAGQWIDVPFVPGTVLVMAGEFLHFYSNKRFKAALHRVVLPSEHQPGRHPRSTLIYFEHPDGHLPMWPHNDDTASPTPPSVKEYLEGKMHAAQEEAARYRETTGY